MTGHSSLTAIARKHELTVDCLRRHKTNHLNPAVVAVARQRQSEGSAISVYAQLEELVVHLRRLVAKAEKRGAMVASAQLLGQWRQVLETLGRISGELNDRPVTNIINLGTSPEWIAVRSALFAVLSQYPDAKAGVIDALSHALPAALEAGNA
jgi:hypothetical protein